MSSPPRHPDQPGRITAAQCRGARVMLGWSQEELAEKAGISVRALINFEQGKTTPYRRTMTDLLRCLQEAGAEFSRSEGRVGVSVRGDGG